MSSGRLFPDRFARQHARLRFTGTRRITRTPERGGQKTAFPIHATGAEQVRQRQWPSFEMSLAGAPQREDGRDRSRADFWWSYFVPQRGWSQEDAEAKLLEVSEKARERVRLGDEGCVHVTVASQSMAGAQPREEPSLMTPTDLAEVLGKIGDESSRNGTDKLSSREIDHKIKAARRVRQHSSVLLPGGETKQNWIRTPSFKGLSPASDASSRVMKMNRSTDTSHERLLRSILFKRGLRFRKNVSALPGKPDVVFAAARVVIFCDGDFWHGRDWRQRSRKLRDGTNAAYWISKIEANRSRDRRNNRALERGGWTVIRVWETDIRNNPELVASRIEKAVLENLQRLKSTS